MARRRRGRGGLDADEVLAGRAAVDVHQLVRLIHSVNPTGRGLGPREEARAYATKSALQSLLVRRFFEHVGVTESAPGVVALSLRETGELAAHCPIDELEEDARSRVRFALDVGPESDTVPQAATRPSGRGYAERAQEALGQYDYERAQAILRGACREAPADPAPAIALVELLVDQLGDPSAALEHWASLDLGLHGEPRIKGAIAVAAALDGDVSLARELLGTLRGERAAEAWVHLARRAMVSGDAALALSAREAIAAEAPADPAIREVDGWVAARATEARREAEARLLEAQAAGLAADALAEMASDLEQRHPGSAVASRVLRGIQAAAVRAKIEALLASAEEQAPHDDAAAVAMWREALSLGADRSAFEGRLEAAEGRLRSERVARAIDHIAAAFTHDREAALVRALESEREVRQELLARLEPQDVELLSRAARLSARPKASARAALAFESAACLLERDQHAEAARLLDGHGKLLDALPETPALRQRVAEARQREQEGAAALSLEAARAALERGELDEAKRAIGRVRADGLCAARAAEHARLLATIEDAERERVFEATLELREREGSWLEIARACDAARERASPEHAAALGERATRAWAQVHQAYRFALLPIGAPDECKLPPLGVGTPITSPLSDSAGAGVQITVTGGAGWMIIRSIELSSDAVLRVACLRPPDAAPAERPEDVRVHAGHLAVSTSESVVYTFSLENGALSGVVSLDVDGDRRSDVVLATGSHYAWLLEDDASAIVFDTRTGQRRRTLPGFHSLFKVPGAPIVIRSSSDEGRESFDAFDARGSAIAKRVLLPARLLSVGDAAYDGAIDLVCVREPADGGPSHIVARSDLSTGITTTLLELDVRDALDTAFAVAPDGIFVESAMADRVVLDAYGPGSPERRWRVELEHATLASSGRGEPAYALVPRPGGQRHVRLSLEPPDLEAAPSASMDRAPSVKRQLPLTKAARAMQAGRSTDGLTDREHEQLPGMILGLAATSGPEGEEATAGRLAAVARGEDPRAVDLLLDALERSRPLGPVLRAWRAKRALDGGRFGEATSMVDAIEPLVEQPELRSWCRWARGIAAYASGEIERAIEAWTTEAEDEHAHECRRLIEHVSLLHRGDGAPQDADVALLRAIRESDERASAGDLDGAIDALDHHLVWLLHEPQSFGRLAARHLERQPRSAGQWLRKLEVLIELVMTKGEAGLVVAVPGAHWSEERLQAIRADARRWLDEVAPPSA